MVPRVVAIAWPRVVIYPAVVALGVVAVAIGVTWTMAVPVFGVVLATMLPMVSMMTAVLAGVARLVAKAGKIFRLYGLWCTETDG